MNTPPVSVVIVNYNGEGSLEPTIRSVLAQQYSAIREILLADNRSTDGSVELVRRLFPSVRIIQTSGNRGPNPARNLGIREVSTDLVLIMDNDIILSPDYVDRLVGVVTSTPEAGIAGGQVRLHGTEEIQYNGILIHYAGAAVLLKDHAPGPVRVGSLSAGAALLDRNQALRIGLFDEDFFFGWEDGDFAFRMNLSGHPLFFVPEAVCRHMKQKRGLKWVRYQVRNRWWFMIKNYDARTFWLALPAILFYQAGVGGLCLLKGHFMDFLKGSFDVLRSLPAVLKKRRFVMALKRVPDSRLLVGEPIDALGDVGEEKFVWTVNAFSNLVLSVYWRFLKRCIR